MPDGVELSSAFPGPLKTDGANLLGSMLQELRGAPLGWSSEGRWSTPIRQRSSTPLRGRAPIPFASLSLPSKPGTLDACAAASGGSQAAAGESTILSTPDEKALKRRVRVGIRCRPAFEDEGVETGTGRFSGSVSVVRPEQARGDRPARMGRVRVTGTVGLLKQKDFYFDYTFDRETSQEEVYEQAASPIVQEVLSGHNGAVLLYGQTGTGKTYTMGLLDMLDEGATGIVPQALQSIFYALEEQTSGPAAFDAEEGISTCDITMSFLQIYREKLHDLLSPLAVEGRGGNTQSCEQNLSVREDPKRGFYVLGLQRFLVSSAAEAMVLINIGLSRRALAPTAVNSTSSRSHTILTITIDRRHCERSNSQSTRPTCTRRLRSRLDLVDLAGSERMGRSATPDGRRMSEACAINTSLSALGNVIAALADNPSSTRQHVPYRDSKLTQLLQEALSGSASTVLLGTISPAAACVSETLSTLTFAARCMNLRVAPPKHEQLDYEQLCARLQDEVASTKASFARREMEQRSVYESVITSLTQKLTAVTERLRSRPTAPDSPTDQVQASNACTSSLAVLKTAYETACQLADGLYDVCAAHERRRQQDAHSLDSRSGSESASGEAPERSEAEAVHREGLVPDRKDRLEAEGRRGHVAAVVAEESPVQATLALLLKQRRAHPAFDSLNADVDVIARELTAVKTEAEALTSALAEVLKSDHERSKEAREIVETKLGRQRRSGEERASVKVREPASVSQPDSTSSQHDESVKPEEESILQVPIDTPEPDEVGNLAAVSVAVECRRSASVADTGRRKTWEDSHGAHERISNVQSSAEPLIDQSNTRDNRLKPKPERRALKEDEVNRVLQKVFSLSEEDLNKLPPEGQAAVRQLRERLELEKNKRPPQAVRSDTSCQAEQESHRTNKERECTENNNVMPSSVKTENPTDETFSQSNCAEPSNATG